MLDEMRSAARRVGSNRRLRSLLLAWDERYALLTVLIASFGRAVSEVGAVMVVGGNIDGFTRVMTTAIALETIKGDLPLALALGSGDRTPGIPSPAERGRSAAGRRSAGQIAGRTGACRTQPPADR